METETIGKYTLVSKIADGGMAEVFLAQTGGVGGFAKRVALKKILPYFTSDKSFVHSFINEARICGQLHHINLVEVFGFDRSDDVYYLAMEYIDGLDLERILAHLRSRKEPFPIAMACALTLQVLDGLHYAHRARGLDGRPLNVIHRDLKPSNILIDRSGVIKIVDFGIAKASSNVYKTRDLGTAKGTVGYMSPEQAVGAVDLAPSSDIFSVGIILYELLTLRRLFEGKNVFAILEAVRTADVDAQLDELTALPEGLRKVLSKALAREQADRYQSAGEMIRDLRGVSPAGRGHDLLSRFVRQLSEQGLTPLHGDSPAPEEGDAATGAELRTRLLNIASAPDDLGPAPVRNADEATLPLPKLAPAPRPPAARAIPLASLAADGPSVAQTQPVSRRSGETTEVPVDFDPADTWVPPRPSDEPTRWPMGMMPGSLLEPMGDLPPAPPAPPPPAASRANLVTEVADLPSVGADMFRDETTDDHFPSEARKAEPPSPPPPPTEDHPTPKAKKPRRDPDAEVTGKTHVGAAPGGTLRGKLLLAVVSLIAVGVVAFLYSHAGERPGIYLRVESMPAEAAVYMDGARVLSSTPGTFFLPLTAPQTISLTLRKAGYKDFVQSAIDVSPTQTNVTFNFTLEQAAGKGTLRVDSSPAGAAIWIDGLETGRYTPADLEVEAGPHTVLLTRDGYRDLNLDVTVSTTGRTMMDHTLEPR